MEITCEQLIVLNEAVQTIVRDYDVTEPLGRARGPEAAPDPPPPSAHANLSPAELQALVFIGGAGAPIVKEVTDHLGIPMTTTSSILERLDKKGLLHRPRSRTDRRVVQPTLTDSGRAVRERAIADQLAKCRRMLEALDHDERSAFIRLVAKIAEATRTQTRTQTQDQDPGAGSGTSTSARDQPPASDEIDAPTTRLDPPADPI